METEKAAIPDKTLNRLLTIEKQRETLQKEIDELHLKLIDKQARLDETIKFLRMLEDFD